MTEETVAASSSLRSCSVVDLAWNPRLPLLAFCGRTTERAHLALLSKVDAPEA